MWQVPIVVNILYFLKHMDFYNSLQPCNKWVENVHNVYTQPIPVKTCPYSFVVYSSQLNHTSLTVVTKCGGSEWIHMALYIFPMKSFFYRVSCFMLMICEIIICVMIVKPHIFSRHSNHHLTPNNHTRAWGPKRSKERMHKWNAYVESYMEWKMFHGPSDLAPSSSPERGGHSTKPGDSCDSKSHNHWICKSYLCRRAHMNKVVTKEHLVENLDMYVCMYVH